MSIGLQTFDETGAVILDTTTIVGLAIGNISTGTVNGSYTDSRLSEGTPFAMSQPNLMGPGTVAPVVTLSADTISWEYPPGNGERASCIIVFGIM